MHTELSLENLATPRQITSSEPIERFPGTRNSTGRPRVLPLRELASDVRRLSEVSDFKALLAVVRQWLVIGITVATFIVASKHMSWAAWVPAYAVACLIIASRQHAFLALVHEGTHYRLSTNRPWNDFVSDFLCGFPVGMCTDVYRRRHLLHHLHTNTHEDPDWSGMQSDDDWNWPKDHVATAKLFALDLVGLAAPKILFLLFIWSPLQAALQKHVSLSLAERVSLIAFLVLTISGLTLSHGWGWFLLLWFVPLITIFGALVRLRSIAEHLVCPSDNELNETRHVDAAWFERLTLAPLNVNYHLAHHLFPSVPWYNLPQLQARMEEFEVFKQNAKITLSYLGWRHGVLGEILKHSGGKAV